MVQKPQNQNGEQLDIQEMFTFISEKSQNIITSFSADGLFTYVSPTVTELLGYTPDEIIGQPAVDFNHPEDNRELFKLRSSLPPDRNTERFTGRVRHKNGEYRWYETTVQYIRDECGEIVQCIGVGRDITARKEAEETIKHLAYHDTLTDLPNRRLFHSHASQVLATPAQQLHGLMLLDLDGFKDVNDTFGHEIGDLLLVEVANRLTSMVGNEGMVARWGGDEFTILLPDLENRDALICLAGRIKDVMSSPADIDGHTCCVNVSIGIAFHPVDGDSVRALIRHADAQMYAAKAK